MKKFYTKSLKNFLTVLHLFFFEKNNFKYRNTYLLIVFTILFQSIFTTNISAQKLQFSYSYFNLTRNTTGGTLQQGDTIEVHALVKVNAATNNFFYRDTIHTGMKYIDSSLKMTTNEGVSYSGSGPFTNATNDDRGVYDTTIPGVRVNIGTGFSNAQSGAGFGSATGGGTVTAGSVPKFYGSTLFIVAYKLLVTANYGDTIHPTGNFYFDTSGVTTTYRFNYAGIKVIQNQALCNNFSSATFTAESSFSSGTIQNRLLGATVPGYTKINIGPSSPADNYYAIVNNTSADGTTNNAGAYKPTLNASRVFGGYWDIIGDHTNASNQNTGNAAVAIGQAGGYMLVVNAAFTTGEAYRDTIKNVCPNTYYEFSAWVRNICGVCGIDQNSASSYTPGVLPNLSYTINDIDYYTTGNIPHDTLWKKRGFIYKTGPAETQFRITIKNNAAGGGGNDWVLDDIKLATCYPNLINSPKDTATSCRGVLLTLSDTVKSYFDNYNYFCWEKSMNGSTWASTGVCGTKTPVLVNGNWQYVVDTTFTATTADSGTYYRLKVGTTYSNLNDSACSVNNSQKIYLKIYNVNCTTLQASILNFNGTIVNNKASLKWNAENETGLKSYIVEKSIDGKTYLTLGSPENSNVNNDYFYNDPDPVSAVAYYRLKLLSNTGNNFTYSKVIALYNKDAAFKVNTTNPFRASLTADVFVPRDGETDLYLFDVLGKPVSKKNLFLNKGTTSVTLDDVDRLAPGMYILRVKFNNRIIQEKLFKFN